MKANHRRLTRFLTFAAWLVCMVAPVAAEDIDIFAGNPSNNDLPNVLIVWDNSGNWASNIGVKHCTFIGGPFNGGGPTVSEDKTKMSIEKCAIYNVIAALPTKADGSALYNVGLMLYNDSAKGLQGSYPRQQFLPLDEPNKTKLLTLINNIHVESPSNGGDATNNAPFTFTLDEAYLMFSKGVPLNGTTGNRWDPAAVANGRYVGPPGSGCGANHIIYVANGSPQGEASGQAQALLKAVGGNTTQINYPTKYITQSDQANWADEFARFMRTVDVNPNADGTQSITTHGVAVTGAPSDGLYPNFIHAIANQGRGQYASASDASALISALTNIFNSILARDTSFASASLPISVNATSTYKNQVFIGQFRPDALARPRWFGNLKQYQFVYDPGLGTLELGDKDGRTGIIAADTGFIDPAATSFWTTASTFWVNDPKGTPKSASDLPDGEVVEKGAVAEVLRIAYATDQTKRPVYTCTTCTSGAALSAETFDISNSAITKALLNAANDTERDLIIDWVRGVDNKTGDELGPGGTTTVRPSIHGDVLHSRPAVVDYGGSIGTIVFYGANDGYLRAIDGNQTGATAGKELWGFIPSETFGRFKRLRDNTPEIRFPATPLASSAIPREYFVDGSITVYQKLSSTKPVTVEEAVIYVTMRRGGRFLYAFDVTTPTAPKFLWKKSNSNISYLGQTWSDPRVAMLKGYPLNPVLIMGAGYDAAAEDATSVGGTTMGNAVIVLDAMTGALINTSKLATDRSAPASVALADTDYDGYVDRAYAVDVGGTVYRIDFETASGDSAPADWKITKFAALGNDPASKFFYAPDLVQTALFTALLLGSGDREKPLQCSDMTRCMPAQSTQNRFYTLLDYATGKGAAGVSEIDVAKLEPIPVSNGFTFNPAHPGCYLNLTQDGEKVVNAAASIGGYTYFSTNRPDLTANNSCSLNLGIATTYQLPLFCGSPTSKDLAGGGLPPSSVIGMVEVQIQGEPPGTTKIVPFIINSTASPVPSAIAPSLPPITVDPTRRRTFWFTNKSR